MRKSKTRLRNKSQNIFEEKTEQSYLRPKGNECGNRGCVFHGAILTTKTVTMVEMSQTW